MRVKEVNKSLTFTGLFTLFDNYYLDRIFGLSSVYYNKVSKNNKTKSGTTK